MMNNVEFWGPGNCGEADVEYDNVLHLSSTSSVLREFDNQDEESFGTSEQRHLIPRENQFQDKASEEKTCHVTPEVRALSTNSGDVGGYDATIKLKTLESDNLEHQR